jgi:hypothetical protein
MSKLSDATWGKVQQLFPPKQHHDVASLLLNECGNNLPFCENSNEHELERIRFAVLKLSQGNVDKLRDEIGFAKIDWRDTLMAAGFGHSVEAHKEWRVPSSQGSS